MMLVGNKCDRIAEREVSRKEGKRLAKQLNCEFVETSAKERVIVEKAFHDVVRQLWRQRTSTPRNHGQVRPLENHNHPSRSGYGIPYASRNGGPGRRGRNMNASREWRCVVFMSANFRKIGPCYRGGVRISGVQVCSVRKQNLPWHIQVLPFRGHRTGRAANIIVKNDSIHRNPENIQMWFAGPAVVFRDAFKQALPRHLLRP